MSFLGSQERRLLAVMTGIFLFTVALGVHGFSLPLWRSIIDHSRVNELWVGTLQGIRGDDWGAQLPSVLSQLSHHPKFPIVNENIGLGQNMLAYPHVPTADFFVLFRPSVWGFFLGPDTGMAWQWWARFLGMLYGFFLLFQWVTGNRFWLSLFSSVAFLFSPFVQFWALNAGEMLASLALSAVLATEILVVPSKGWGLFARALGLWWAGCVFALGFYPAFQVPLAYAGVGLVAYLVLLCRRGTEKCPPLGSRLLILLAITGAILGTVGLFFLRTKGVFETMMHTAYPGARHENGGGEAVYLFFSNFIRFFSSPGVYDVLGNICEAASFFFFFPLCALASLLSWSRDRFPAQLPLYAALLFLMAWMFFGFPDPLPSWTLMKHVTTTRVFIAIGVINSVLIAAHLAEAQPEREFPAWLRRSVPLVWIAFLFYVGLALRNRLPGISLPVVLYSVAGMGLLGGLIFYRSKWAAPGLALVSFLITMSFNPLVRGGSDFLQNNPLSRAMKSLDTREGGKSVWIVTGGLTLGNLPKILGLKSYSGQYFYPQLELWKRFDPEGRYMSLYNRYAHSVWEMRPGVGVELYTPQADILRIRIDPRNQILRDLGVDYFLVQGDDSLFAGDQAAFESVFAYENNHIYRYRRTGP